jgi:hypothetical protein
MFNNCSLLEGEKGLLLLFLLLLLLLGSLSGELGGGEEEEERERGGEAQIRKALIKYINKRLMV